MMTGQRRGAAIAMTDGERDAFLRTQPVCRVATLGPGGHPHVSALWFVWDGTALWLKAAASGTTDGTAGSWSPRRRL